MEGRIKDYVLQYGRQATYKYLNIIQMKLKIQFLNHTSQAPGSTCDLWLLCCTMQITEQFHYHRKFYWKALVQRDPRVSGLEEWVWWVDEMSGDGYVIFYKADQQRRTVLGGTGVAGKESGFRNVECEVANEAAVGIQKFWSGIWQKPEMYTDIEESLLCRSGWGQPCGAQNGTKIFKVEVECDQSRLRHEEKVSKCG